MSSSCDPSLSATTVRDARDASKPLSGKLAGMRFMLRAKDVEEARIIEKRSAFAAATINAAAIAGVGGASGATYLDSPPVLVSARSTGGGGGGGARQMLVIAVADDESTAARILGTAVTDSGACVGGRRSWKGAHKGVEAFARAAYADFGTGGSSEPDVSDVAMAHAIAPQRKQKRGGGGGGGGEGKGSRPSGLSIINGVAPRSSLSSSGRSGKMVVEVDSDEEEEEEREDTEALREAIQVSGGRRQNKHERGSSKRARVQAFTAAVTADKSEVSSSFSSLPFIRPT